MSRNNLPKSAIIAVTSRCNSRCLMCSIWQRRKQEEVNTELYKELPPHLKFIDITGGEPFLRNDLEEIVKILKGTCPEARLLITTNGLLVEKIKKVAPFLLKVDKKLVFRVSLDGWGKIHDKVRRIPGAFGKVIKSIEILNKLGVKDLGIIFTLMKINKNDLEKVLDFCKKKNLHFSLNLIHESPIYFGQKHSVLRPTLKDTKKSLNMVANFFLSGLNCKDWAKAWFYRKLANFAQTRKRPIKCGAGESFFYLDPLGNVYICHLKNWKIGNLKKQSFRKIWEGKKRKKYLKLARNCHDCFMICTTRDEIAKKKWWILANLLLSPFEKLTNLSF